MKKIINSCINACSEWKVRGALIIVLLTVALFGGLNRIDNYAEDLIETKTEVIVSASHEQVKSAINRCCYTCRETYKASMKKYSESMIIITCGFNCLVELNESSSPTSFVEMYVR